MLNSTLHLNVFGRVNTALIDKDSQCIYQLSRLSTLSHWSLPWSRGGRREPEKGGNRTAVILKRKKRKTLLHTFLCCNLAPFVVSVMLSLICPTRFGLYCHIHAIHVFPTQKILSYITKHPACHHKWRFISQQRDASIPVPHRGCPIPSFSHVTVMRCHGIPQKGIWGGRSWFITI